MEGIGGVIKRKSELEKKKPSSKKDHLPGIEIPEVRAEKYIHSPEHALAAEMSAFFGERKKFVVYLGIIRRIGLAQARATFSSMKSDDTNIRNPRKFFMWLSRVEKKKPKTRPKKKPGKQLDMRDFLA